ncbi:hypothetical protein GGE24_005584 [Bradyrhizobium centrosematis]|nr:hypothetical protein [Bradyrhizobium centrosematis]MCS3776228.1 hypothetical protein [Bradyrhizobium centrosematis]
MNLPRYAYCVMLEDLDQIAAAFPEDVEIASVRIALRFS